MKSMPSKGNILEYWGTSNFFKIKELDVIQPQCWACKWDGYRDEISIESELKKIKLDKLRENYSKPEGIDEFIKISKALINKIKKKWDQADFLERCHIIPESIGGASVPENLFLLCRKCHDDAPDINSKKLFLLWAEKREFCISDFFMEVSQIFEKFVPNDKISKLKEIAGTEEFKEWYKKNTGIHPIKRSRWIGKPSTFIFAAIHFLELKENKNQ